MIKCVTIDDQTSSLSTLHKYIEQTPNMQLQYSYTNPVIALRELSLGENTDLIFLDVEMPQISGIELAQVLRSKTNKLIFTTSHQEYAFQAYEAAGDAYLLKPYSYAKFITTITRIYGASLNDINNEDYFLVKNKEEEHRAVLVKYTDIIAFESFNNYVKIHTVDKTIIAYLSLKDIRDQLSLKQKFVQFHRGFIIAVEKIVNIEGAKINMGNGITFFVGDSYNTEFRNFINERLIMSSRKR